MNKPSTRRVIFVHCLVVFLPAFVVFIDASTRATRSTSDLLRASAIDRKIIRLIVESAAADKMAELESIRNWAISQDLANSRNERGSGDYASFFLPCRLMPVIIFAREGFDYAGEMQAANWQACGDVTVVWGEDNGIQDEETKRRNPLDDILIINLNYTLRHDGARAYTCDIDDSLCGFRQRTVEYIIGFREASPYIVASEAKHFPLHFD
jgi:hypothetical protein